MKSLRQIVLASSFLVLLGSGSAMAVPQCGDIAGNSDGIKSSDALTILKSAVGQATGCDANLCRCDVNGSGTVTTSDALATLKTAVGGAAVAGCKCNNPNSAGLSGDEIDAVGASMVAALNAAQSDYESGSFLMASQNDYPAVPSGNPRAPIVFQIPMGGVMNCAVAGHITRSGNVTVTVGEDLANIYGLITFLISDPVNNLNDCQVAEGVILNGTITLTLAGDSDSGVGLSVVGSIDINDKNFSKRGSCFVDIRLAKGSAVVTGTVCGEPI
jgi:hypothetical protein